MKRSGFISIPLKKTLTMVLKFTAILWISACSEYDYYAPMECLTGNVSYDTAGAGKKLYVASVAMQCDRNAENNRLKLASFIERIASENPEVELIVFGEMTLGWYEDPDDQKAYQRDLAETIPGPTTDMISDLAVQYQVYITFGMVQLEGGKLFNAQPVIGPDGKILAVHHKTYLTPCDMEAGFEKGKELTVVDIKGIRTGIVICKDQENSNLTKSVFERGCELVIISFADDVVEDFFTYGSDLSRKYNAWLVSANRYGPEGEYFYRGEIRVSDPGGNHPVRKENGEQYLSYDIPFH